MSDSKELLPKCCVLYTTDAGYLFPTFVSAMQARRHSSSAKADVLIFTLGLDEATFAVFQAMCEGEGIRLLPVEASQVDGQNAMMARLFLNRYVPEQYTQYLYVDGDTQIVGSLDPLLEADVPEGRFLAANDPMTFLLEDKNRQANDLTRHLKTMGFNESQALSYFNSGVLRINRQGWDEIGMAAYELMQQGDGPSRFPDQDILNLVGLGSRLPMALAWNFPIFMRNARVESEVSPRIVHFMSNPKPWQMSLPPWTREATKPYQAALLQYPELARFTRPIKWQRGAIYQVQQRLKRISELMEWGYSARRERVLRYEAGCDLSALEPRN